MELAGKIAYGKTFEELQQNVNDWLQTVDVHLYEVGPATYLENSEGWIVGISYYSPSVISHKHCELTK